MSESCEKVGNGLNLNGECNGRSMKDDLYNASVVQSAGLGPVDFEVAIPGLNQSTNTIAF